MMDNKNINALPCIRCDKQLENVGSFTENQPYAGTAFTTHGHYGSTVFDPMDDSFLELNICDDCLKEAAKKKQILEGRKKRIPVTVDYKEWVPYTNG